MFSLHNLWGEHYRGKAPVKFNERYGNDPKSLNGSYARNSNAAAQKRAATKLRKMRARSAK